MSDLKEKVAGKINFGIGKKLTLAFLTVGLMCVLISAVGYFSLETLTAKQNDINTSKSPAIREAMLLENLTIKMVASIPLLSGAQTVDQLQAYDQELQGTFAKMNNQIDVLAPLLDDNEKIENLKSQLASMPTLLSRLNEIVASGLEKEARRGVLANELVAARDEVTAQIDPLRSGMVMKTIEGSDKWIEVIDQSIEQARSTSEDVTYDISELQFAGMHNLNDYGNILEFKASTNLISGLLLEASNNDSMEAITKIEDEFLQKLADMAGVADKLVAMLDDESGSKLDELYQTILILGANGGVNDNILKLRMSELELQSEAAEILSITRQLADQLSVTVTGAVTTIKAQMATAVEESNKIAKSAETALIAIALVSILLIFLVAWLYIQRNLVARLLKLATAMQHIAEGNLTTSVHRNGNDEISLMGERLSILRNGLRETDLLKQQQEEERLEAEREKVESAKIMADDFDQAVGQSISILSVNVGEMRTKATNMSDITTQTLEKTEEANQASDTIHNDIKVVATSADELAHSITEISKQVTNSTKVTDEAVNRAATLNENIQNLEQGSKEIENVIQLINSVAEQTNMLALNATIEAARAGQAGKGFAVVASEVKNLAKQTSTAIDEITKLIASIQGEISNAVESNTQITSVINEINSVSANIASAVEEQSAATNEISRTVKNTSEHVANIALQVSDVSSSIQQNSVIVSDMLDGISHIDEQSGTMKTDLETFLGGLRGQAVNSN